MDHPRHVPVLLDRVVALLAPSLGGDRTDEDSHVAHDPAEPAPVLVDCTLGLGGHSAAVLERCPAARVVGIDRDPDALAAARERLASYGDRFRAAHAVYDELADVLVGEGLDPVGGVAGVLFDLGVSSMQLDRRERGFAYAEDAPLDMRMDGGPEGGRTAADVVNTYSAGELTRVLRDYGEERYAPRIAAAVVRERDREPFTSSARLVELLYDVIPAPARRTGGHPAKRTFQALRMEVNDELGALRRALPAALEAVGVGGRVVVEAYHSLEDRIVKRAFTAVTRLDVPDDLPFVPEGAQPALRLLTRGAEVASDSEIAANPRAASVRLRAVERVRPARPVGPADPTTRSRALPPRGVAS